VGLSIANLDLGNILSGAGQLAKDLRTAVTGKEPISADKAAEIALKVQEVEAGLEQARMGVMLAEASSQDKWTSRARPAYMYVFYLVIVMLGVVAPLLGVFFPVQMKVFFENVTMGFRAIPNIAWEVFCAGYLGYTGFRSLDKRKEKK
jgi:hypothetical protein